MQSNIQAIRGMNDILPQETAHWQHVEAIMREIVAAYGYHEIRMPIVEKTELFKRSIGEVTDIVEKEMYTFDDRNGDSLTLRPEGTAGCVRSGIENGLLYNQTQRLWYCGPMFRHERPQRGRYRQFHQIGIEAFGMEGPDIDAELIFMSARLLERLGLGKYTVLQLNSLGTAQARQVYREALVTYLKAHESALDEDSRRRMHTNPMRVLDSKNPLMQTLIHEAPRLSDYLDEESRLHFDRLRAILDEAGITYVVNPCLVRGLDYYSRTVFEWVTERLGAQGTVCAGGRYDGLVDQLGGRPTSAVGFAAGMERLVELYKEINHTTHQALPHVYLAMAGDAAVSAGLSLAERLRTELPGLRLISNCGGGGFKAQMKRADKSGASLVLMLGDNEIEEGVVSVKYLREDRPQHQVVLSEVTRLLKETVLAE